MAVPAARWSCVTCRVVPQRQGWPVHPRFCCSAVSAGVMGSLARFTGWGVLFWGWKGSGYAESV